MDKTLRLVRISLSISAIQRVLRFFSGNLFYKSNRKLFPCVCIAWYKRSRRWENSRQLCKPSTSSRVCITVSTFPTPLVFISGYANTENVFYWLSSSHHEHINKVPTQERKCCVFLMTATGTVFCYWKITFTIIDLELCSKIPLVFPCEPKKELRRWARPYVREVWSLITRCKFIFRLLSLPCSFKYL